VNSEETQSDNHCLHFELGETRKRSHIHNKGLNRVFLKRKKQLEVDLSELDKDEKELLSAFLHSTLNVDVALHGNKVSADSEQLSSEELKRLVNKFVYHRNLNRKYWVALEGGTVKINKFEKGKRREKRKKEATQPSTIRHGW